MLMNSENALYEQIAQYMNLKYPEVLYRFDLGGMWTPSHKARNLYGRLNRRAWPDLFVAKSTMFAGTTSPCAGLFLELKKQGTRLKKRDGQWASDHIAEQAAVLDGLRSEGYYAEFATGLDEVIQYLNSYLGLSAPATLITIEEFDQLTGDSDTPQSRPFDKAGFLKAAKTLADDRSTF